MCVAILLITILDILCYLYNLLTNFHSLSAQQKLEANELSPVKQH